MFRYPQAKQLRQKYGEEHLKRHISGLKTGKNKKQSTEFGKKKRAEICFQLNQSGSEYTSGEEPQPSALKDLNEREQILDDMDDKFLEGVLHANSISTAEDFKKWARLEDAYRKVVRHKRTMNKIVDRSILQDIRAQEEEMDDDMELEEMTIPLAGSNFQISQILLFKGVQCLMEDAQQKHELSVRLDRMEDRMQRVHRLMTLIEENLHKGM